MASATPMIRTTPAVPCWLWMFWVALVKICLAGPGATALRLSISGWVADGPTRPRIESKAISAGKIARTP